MFIWNAHARWWRRRRRWRPGLTAERWDEELTEFSRCARYYCICIENGVCVCVCVRQKKGENREESIIHLNVIVAVRHLLSSSRRRRRRGQKRCAQHNSTWNARKKKKKQVIFAWLQSTTRVESGRRGTGCSITIWRDDRFALPLAVSLNHLSLSRAQLKRLNEWNTT